MIPQEKSEAVTRGLREAFGVTEFEEIRALGGGGAHSGALVFRVVVRGSPYLLRIHLRKGDYARHVACMKAASKACIAPRVWHASIKDKVAITDFVEAAPFPRGDALVRAPAVLRMLHALPPFAPSGPFNTSCTFLFHKGPALDGFLRGFQDGNFVPRGECEEVFARYAQAAEVYTCGDQDMVSSHNDLKPANILFDGRSPWLVDWEAAFLNDRYCDLAMVAHSVVTNEAEEKIYLEGYFGKPPDAYQLARLFVTQQLTHMFYSMGYMLMGSAGKPGDPDEKAPEFRDMQGRIWIGELSLDDGRRKIAYGRAHWAQGLRGMRQGRFAESIKTLNSGV